jgi:hypothetical protein
VVFWAYREMDYMRLSTTESKKITKKEALKYTDITLYLWTVFLWCLFKILAVVSISSRLFFLISCVFLWELSSSFVTDFLCGRCS